jgi:hypothetical protein
MRRTAIAGAFSLALTLGGCATKQPAPPPHKLVTEADPVVEAAPAPPTQQQILAEQPPEVQQAVKAHDKHGNWSIYRTRPTRSTRITKITCLWSIARRCGLPTTPAGRDDHRRCAR